MTKHYIGILNVWIVIPQKYTKLNAQQIKFISQYSNTRVRVFTHNTLCTHVSTHREDDFTRAMREEYSVTPGGTPRLHVRQPVTHVFTEWVAVHRQT